MTLDTISMVPDDNPVSGECSVMKPNYLVGSVYL